MSKIYTLIAAAISAAVVVAQTSVAQATAASGQQTEMPMVTVGGPNSQDVRRRIIAGPVIEGLRLSLTPSVVQPKSGSPIVVSLWLNSVGDRDRLVCFGAFRNALKFYATDASGKELVQTEPGGLLGGTIRGNRCDLEPYKQWRYEIPINKFVDVRNPGVYYVKASLTVVTGGPGGHDLQLQSNAVQLEVTN
jgi:hypothetical protein